MDSTLEAAFRQFDADGNGTLDESELAAAYEAAGRPIPNDKLRRIIKMLDTNGDGVIDMEVRAMPHGPFFSSASLGRKHFPTLANGRSSRRSPSSSRACQCELIRRARNQ